MANERATGLKATKGIELLTFSTPNGFKVSILLEELKDAYGLEYTWQGINIRQNIQKEPWFTKLGPNGRIPVIVDHDQGGFAVQEGLAILTYLTRHYDPDHKFSFSDPLDISRAEQWLSWHHAGLGPIMAQSFNFNRIASERIAYGMQRFTGETERLVGVLEAHLQDKQYLVGEKFSIADIANYVWIDALRFCGVEIDDFPQVKAWWERISARPAVQRGLAIPAKGGFGNVAYSQRLAEDKEFAEKEEELRQQIAEAKKQYGYKYASP